MDAERAWQSALGQLQMEMPKASFDTWVRDTQVVSYEDGTFTIGVRNEYARDWLESRLTSTVTRLMTGIMNRDVGVRFVVHTGEEIVEAGDDDAGQAEEGSAAKKEVDVEAVWESAYEQVVMPEKAVALNAYFLRHLRLLGPDLGWLYIGFRQAAYNTGARTGRKSARFSGKEIATMSGATERTFWNRVKRNETWKRLAGLVNPIAPEVKEWSDGPLPRRLPRRYSVAMTLPLTAADVRLLTDWIAAHIEQCGGPEGVLTAAYETPVETLIPSGAPTPVDDQPLTVRTIVRDLFCSELPREQVDSLAERLQMHLMPPGDLLFITHFFIERILPWLGTGPGWMLTILRDRCFVDPDSGAKRSQVTVKGGYAEIAKWMGLSRPLTVYEWLRDPIVQIYLHAERNGIGKNKWDAPRQIEVLLEEVPAEIIQAAIAQDETRLFGDAIFSIGVTRFSVSELRDFQKKVTRFSVSELRDFQKKVTRLSESFKLLNSLNQTLNSKTPPPPTPSSKTQPQEKPVVVVAPVSWNLQNILTANCKDDKLRKSILYGGGTPQALISWLLYTFSTRGEGLRPDVNYALSKLKQHPDIGAGGAFDHLAALLPAELVRLIRRSVDKTQGRRYSDWLEEKSDNEMLWDTTMGMSYQHKKLLEILLGEGERSVEETVVTVEHDYMGVKTKEITRTKYIE